jgi:hypothetical protein
VSSSSIENKLVAERNFTEVAVLLRDNDNVAVLKRALNSGDHLANGSIDLRAAENIGAGHKIAILRRCEAGDLPCAGKDALFSRFRSPGWQRWHPQLRCRHIECQLLSFSFPLCAGSLSH